MSNARAQQEADRPPVAALLPGIEILPTAYLWLPWTSVGIRPANANISSQSTTIGPGDLYSHLTWVPFMGQAEIRSGAFGVVTDFIHAPLKASVSTGDVLFGSGTTDFTINTGSAVFLYRALTSPDQTADVGLGFRAWGLGGQIAVNPRHQRLAPIAVANGLSWADPLIARALSL
jgi:hypothetical protein